MLDMDGVLTTEVCYNEPDVSSYEELCEKCDRCGYWWHLHYAHPFLLPTRPVLAVVTGRLHFYKAQTTAWLDRYHVERILGLYMSPYDRPKERPARDACGNTACLKASALENPRARFLIESKRWQAEQIHRMTQKPVFCTQNMRLYGETHNL